MNNYYYKQSEPGLWTVGTGEGKSWCPESDHTSPEEAASRVNFLNGGGIAITMDEVNKKSKQTEQYQVFRAAYILHKYFARGDMRPIKEFALMIIGIATDSSYEETNLKYAAMLVETIKNHLDLQLINIERDKQASEEVKAAINIPAIKGKAIYE